MPLPSRWTGFNVAFLRGWFRSYVKPEHSDSFWCWAPTLDYVVKHKIITQQTYANILLPHKASWFTHRLIWTPYIHSWTICESCLCQPCCGRTLIPRHLWGSWWRDYPGLCPAVRSNIVAAAWMAQGQEIRIAESRRTALNVDLHLQVSCISTLAAYDLSGVISLFFGGVWDIF